MKTITLQNELHAMEEYTRQACLVGAMSEHRRRLDALEAIRLEYEAIRLECEAILTGIQEQ